MKGEYVPKDVVEAVTPEMIKAGLDRFHDLSGETNMAYVVEAIYLAMEYQRLDSLGQLRRLVRHSAQKG